MRGPRILADGFALMISWVASGAAEAGSARVCFRRDRGRTERACPLRAVLLGEIWGVDPTDEIGYTICVKTRKEYRLEG